MEAARTVAVNMVGPQDADDVVQEAVLSLAKRVEADGVEAEVNWLALFLRYTQWAGLDWLKKQREIAHFEGTALEPDGPSSGDGRFVSEADEDGGRLTSPDRHTPAWPTAIERTTPEDIVTAAQLRDLIREIAVQHHGARDYAIFCAVVMDGIGQARVAKEHEMSQGRISQVVQDVRGTLMREIGEVFSAKN
jgi:RNA polymerase sigma factor (sigma-70 family)